MTSRGLPGFLRRTRRSDFGESEDEDYFSSDDDVEDSNSLLDDNAHPMSSPASNETDKETKSQDQDEFVSISASTKELSDSATSDEFELKNEKTTEATPPPKDRVSSLNQREDSVSSLESGGRRVLDRKLSYRESKFDSIFAANTVKMSDLRTLGWNGIPVCCSFFHRFCSWKCSFSPLIPYHHV